MTIASTGDPCMRDRVRLVRDGASGVVAIHARFNGHAYDLHYHDEWLVGVTDDGVQDFFCRGERRRRTTGRVILIEPGEMHDGRAGGPQGFSYSMLYLPKAWLQTEVQGRLNDEPSFRATLSDDPVLGTAIGRACEVLGRPPERLARYACLDAVLEALRPHLGRPRPALDRFADGGAARRARDFLRDWLDQEISGDGLARAAGAADRFQLARAFRAAYGTSPHRYLLHIRLTRARSLLGAGASPATVAADCGFSDQSHLGRWFRRAYGLTPSAYRETCRPGISDTRPGASR